MVKQVDLVEICKNNRFHHVVLAKLEKENTTSLHKDVLQILQTYFLYFFVKSELNASPTSVSTNIWLHLKMTLDLSVRVQNCSTAPGFSTRFALPRHRMVAPQGVWAPKDRVKSSFVSHDVEMGCFHNFAVHKTMIEIGLNT